MNGRRPSRHLDALKPAARTDLPATPPPAICRKCFNVNRLIIFSLARTQMLMIVNGCQRSSKCCLNRVRYAVLLSFDQREWLPTFLSEKSKAPSNSCVGMVRQSTRSETSSISAGLTDAGEGLQCQRRLGWDSVCDHRTRSGGTLERHDGQAPWWLERHIGELHPDWTLAVRTASGLARRTIFSSRLSIFEIHSADYDG
jgi:hypothetical protein